jgi:hypothetical protein
MAEPNQPKKETVRIALPTETGRSEASAENARLNLPARPPVNAPGATSPPSNPPQTDEAAAPRKETARIALPTEPPSQHSSTSEMKKTQPLFSIPEPAEASVTPPMIASGSEAPVETIPTALCWAVLAVSAVLLIIQIWNYFS